MYNVSMFAWLKPNTSFLLYPVSLLSVLASASLVRVKESISQVEVFIGYKC